MCVVYQTVATAYKYILYITIFLKAQTWSSISLPLQKYIVCYRWGKKISSTLQLNPTEPVWDEVQHRLHPRSHCPTLMPNLSHDLVPKSSQILSVMLQILVEGFTKREVVITRANTKSEIGWSKSMCEILCLNVHKLLAM